MAKSLANGWPVITGLDHPPDRWPVASMRRW